MPKEPDQLTRIETIVKGHTDMLRDLTKSIQGDANVNGLMTRVAILEKHPETCSLITSSKWLSWGLRGIYGSFIVGLTIFLVRSFLP